MINVQIVQSMFIVIKSSRHLNLICNSDGFLN